MHVFLITSELTAIRKRSFDRVLESLKPLGCSGSGGSGGGDVQVVLLDDACAGVIDNEFVDKKVSIDKEVLPEAYRRFVGTMHVRQLHNCVKHLEAITRVAALPDSAGPCLVLEDDVIMGNDHVELLRKRIERAAQDDCVLLLGVPAVSAEYQSVAEVYTVAPTCESYLLRPSAARRMLAEMLPVRFATTVQLTYAAEKTGVPLLVGRPNVFVDGSKYGVFASGLTINNALVLNPVYMRARDVLSAGDRAAPHDVAETERALAENPLKNHPDFMHMAALVALRKRGAGDPATRDAFEAALKGYDQAGCIMNHESHFLNEYLQLFRHAQ